MMKATHSAQTNLLLCVWAMALVSNAVSAATTDWVYEAVEPEKTAGDQAAALDAQDYAHVVYGRDALYYDWEDADGWHSETADASVAPSGLSMVLDDSGRPHVVFLDLLTQHLQYARRDAVGWSMETIAQDACGSPDNLTALCLDAAGRPHVGYTAGSFEALLLKHLNKDASGWHTSTVGSWSGVYLYGLTIRTADDGEPHLACATDDGSFAIQVFHAWHEPSGWQSAQLDLGTVSRALTIQFDAAGRLHLVFYSQSAGSYVMGERDIFQIESVSPGDHTESALVVSSTGAPHAIFDNNYEGLQYWTKTGGVWSQTVIDEGDLMNVEVLLDTEDRPFILYKVRYSSGYPDYNYTNITKSAWQDAQGWHTREESVALWQGANDMTLMLTHDNAPRLAVSSSNGATKFLTRDETGWHERVLAEPGPYATTIRLALDPDENPHIIYAGRYGWHDASGWHTAPLEETKKPGGEGECDLAFDRKGRLHMGYIRSGPALVRGGGLRYAIVSDGRWQSTVLNTNWIYELAIALDGTDHPHFLAREYINETEAKNLVHIWQDEVGWHQETVTTLDFNAHQEGGGVYPDIAVDRAANLHICYCDYTRSNNLRYGYRTTQGWQLATIDSRGTLVGPYCSLALDTEDQPHIAYAAVDYTRNIHDLRYAHKDNTGWHFGTVDSVQTAYLDFRGASLGLAPDGSAHIMYSMGEVGDTTVRYATASGSAWERTDIERGAARSSLVLDSQGRPHVAYWNIAGRNNLSYLWPPAAFHGITWSAVPSPQATGVAVPATLTARNADGGIRTEFTNAVTLIGFAPGLATTNVSIGTGTGSWGYPFYSRYHDARTQVIYPAGELGQACTINSLALEVTAPPGQTLENWTIRMKHTSLDEYPASPEWESDGWTVVYQGNEPAGRTGWRTFQFSTPLEYDGTNNLLVDFSFNNDSYSSDGQCRATETGTYRSLTYVTDSAYGDPLSWSGASPTPVRIQTVPNLVLDATVPDLVPVSLSPTVTTAFVNGVWAGEVTVHEAVTNLILRADDGSGHGGESNPFDVQGVAQPLTILTDDGQMGMTNSFFGFNVQGPAGQEVVFEVSTNLVDWLPLTTNTLGSGPFYFSDLDTTNFTQRFYRAVTP